MSTSEQQTRHLAKKPDLGDHYFIGIMEKRLLIIIMH